MVKTGFCCHSKILGANVSKVLPTARLSLKNVNLSAFGPLKLGTSKVQTFTKLHREVI
jgi:hypothetical protein